MQVKDLTPNSKNPRILRNERFVALKAALREFGDLGGIVFNKKTKRLVSGHQRSKTLEPTAEITIEHRFPKPTKTGTTAQGYVKLQTGERLSYREVFWDETREKAASIAANNNAGEWDHDQLAVWLKDLEESEYDMALTMFADKDLDTFLNTVTVSEHERNAKGEGAVNAKAPEEFLIVVQCSNEREMEKLFEELSVKRGLECKLIR